MDKKLLSERVICTKFITSALRYAGWDEIRTYAYGQGDPEEPLARLEEAEREAAALRDQLKAILAEAHLR